MPTGWPSLRGPHGNVVLGAEPLDLRAGDADRRTAEAGADGDTAGARHADGLQQAFADELVAVGPLYVQDRHDFPGGVEALVLDAFSHATQCRTVLRCDARKGYVVS